MATPNLDKELLRLRRRIGDIYTTAGAAFTAVPGSTNLNLDGPGITSAELVDIYNQSVREFLTLMVAAVPSKNWSKMVPGYIITVPEIVPETTLGSSALSADFIKLASVKSGETVKRIIELRAIAGTPLFANPGHNIGVEYPPEILQEVLSNSLKVYAQQTMFTILNTLVSNNTDYTNAIVITPKSTTPANSKYCIVFLKEHVDLVQASSLDLSYSDIPMSTLDVIASLAEREYITRRQFDDFGVNAQRINETMNSVGR